MSYPIIEITEPKNIPITPNPGVTNIQKLVDIMTNDTISYTTIHTIILMNNDSDGINHIFF